jgi:hypothetical protein
MKVGDHAKSGFAWAIAFNLHFLKLCVFHPINVMSARCIVNFYFRRADEQA